MAGTKSENIENVILFQIEQASKVSKQYSQRKMDEVGMGITIEQWVLLKVVSESTNLTQKELALKSSRDPASITRTLDILERKELINRTPIENNRRGYHIELSEEGARFVKRYFPFIKELRKKSVEGLNDKDLKELSRMLLKIKENMG